MYSNTIIYKEFIMKVELFHTTSELKQLFRKEKNTRCANAPRKKKERARKAAAGILNSPKERA